MTGAPVAMLQVLGQCGFCRGHRQGQELDAANAEPVESPETLVRAPSERPATASQPGRRRIAPANDGPVPDELVLERYRLLERLGAGGFGVVWRARDELLHREVAVKRISLGAGGGPIDSERASREALASARLAHPAIVALYEACPHEGAFYLISELVDGDTLARLIEQDELEDEQILEIGAALASALAHAHARGVIHRDIKPQNVLVPASSAELAAQTPQNLVAAAKLADFGGASLVGEDALTRTGDVLGTLAYMAPEQSEGREVGVEADLYSLALVLYEALCGVNPVRGATPAATVRRIGRPLPALARARRDLPARAHTRARSRAGAGSRSSGERSTSCATRSSTRSSTGCGARAGAAPRRSHGGPTPATPPRRSFRASREPRPPVPSRSRTSCRPGPSSTLGSLSRTAPRPRNGAIWLPRVRGSAPLARSSAGRRSPGGRAWPCCCSPHCCRRCSSAPRVQLASGLGWLAAALAPALGLAGLAAAFPAIAGQASSWRMRAALGALGYWWLTLAGPLLGRDLWLAAAHGAPRALRVGGLAQPRRDAHRRSAAGRRRAARVRCCGRAAAIVLPLLVRGYSAVRDVAAVAIWSAAIVAATPVLDAGLHAHAAHPSPRGLLLGALLGGFVAVAARAVRGPV